MEQSYHTYRWAMSHWWMSHVTHMNESCHTCEWARILIWVSHVTHMNESCHTYERVMSHTWMSHDAHMNESWYTYVWVMSHMRMRHVTHMKESCYGVDTIIRLLKIIGLFCKRALWKRLCSAKENICVWWACVTHMWKKRVSPMNGSSHVTHMNE